MGLTAPVVDGQVESTAINSTKIETKGTSTLGKDAFLQLLVAQMKYQDPLQPSSDTEWIAQMAQFSSLEQMQNMNSTITNSQAFSMNGQIVEILADDKIVTGKVDYVSVSNGIAYVSVNDNLYEASKVTSVLSTAYLQQQYGPQVSKQDVTYDYDNPVDCKLAVSLGQDEYAASGLYVAIGEKLVDSQYLSYDKENKILTISKEAFYGLTTGQTYDISFLFDDSASTTISEVVTLKVTGKQPADASEETNGTEDATGSEEVTGSEKQDENKLIV